MFTLCSETVYNSLLLKIGVLRQDFPKPFPHEGFAAIFSRNADLAAKLIAYWQEVSNDKF
ncbi:MAG: hypothetical protein KAT34_12645 [Candidatus Aminicenantes bacterium]|nr:hypothetical protein [Candidatus Aminicenantes bacterium]